MFSSHTHACMHACTHLDACLQPHPDGALHVCGQALEKDGHGKVLVVDGGGSLRCALLGDNIAEMAYKNGWSVSACLTVRMHYEEPATTCMWH